MPFRSDQGMVFPQRKTGPTRRKGIHRIPTKISRRQWTQLIDPMAKYDLEIVMEFYANAWPTKEGFMEFYANVWRTKE